MITLIALLIALSLVGSVIGAVFKITLGLLKGLLIIPAVICVMIGIFVMSLPVIGVLIAAGVIYAVTCGLLKANVSN